MSGRLSCRARIEPFSSAVSLLYIDRRFRSGSGFIRKGLRMCTVSNWNVLQSPWRALMSYVMIATQSLGQGWATKKTMEEANIFHQRYLEVTVLCTKMQFSIRKKHAYTVCLFFFIAPTDRTMPSNIP